MEMMIIMMMVIVVMVVVVVVVVVMVMMVMLVVMILMTMMVQVGMILASYICCNLPAMIITMVDPVGQKLPEMKPNNDSNGHYYAIVYS